MNGQITSRCIASCEKNKLMRLLSSSECVEMSVQKRNGKRVEKTARERLSIRYRCQSMEMMQKKKPNRFKCINPNSVSLFVMSVACLVCVRFATLRGMCDDWWVAMNALTWKNPIKNRFISIATTSIHILCATREEMIQHKIRHL